MTEEIGCRIVISLNKFVQKNELRQNKYESLKKIMLAPLWVHLKLI